MKRKPKKETRAKAKPVKAWAVIFGSKIDITDIFRTKWQAKEWASFYRRGYRIVKVEVREL